MLHFFQTLRDCTSKMDSDMWNTYHLMNNRARAVCYAARHQQFRALSEMTVNRLMRTANEQLQTMDMLRVSIAFICCFQFFPPPT